MDSTGSETYIIVNVADSWHVGSKFYIAPLGSWDQFKSINVSQLRIAYTMDYDPVEHMIYWGDMNIMRCRVDGAHEEKITGINLLYV